MDGAFIIGLVNMMVSTFLSNLSNLSICFSFVLVCLCSLMLFINHMHVNMSSSVVISLRHV